MKRTEELIFNLAQQGTISADVAESCLEEVLQQRRLERQVAPQVAIVGVGFRLPGASNLDALAQLLDGKADLVRAFPAARRTQVLDHCPNLERARLVAAPSFEGGFLEAVDLFEPARFGISPGEARLIAPEQRLSLTVAAEALENAGYAPDQLTADRVGVYHGRSESQYHRLLGPKDPSAVPGNISAMTASRISHHFNFGGPCLSVDTTCSSGLVALHLAREHLMRGECDVALVGATHLILFPIDENASARIGSKTHRTKPFDERGDGTGYGEGAICLVLKRLDEALADLDQIYAVVHGSAVNHDGKSSSITAPNLAAQKACLQAAWRASGVDPRALRYIEAHGTGTQLGDPIEWQALTEALAEYTDAKHFCGVGSVKSNFGHLDVAAGLAGVLKLIVAFQRDRFPGTVHFSRPNPHLELDRTGLYVVKDTETWPRAAVPRWSGVSSFGLSGTNCHAVLSDYVQPAEPDASIRALPFPLSAGSKLGLSKVAAKCRAQLVSQNSALPALSYSLAVRRPAEDVRVVILARDRAELLVKLAAVETLADSDLDLTSGGVYRQVDSASFTRQDAVLDLIARWLDGEVVDWMPVYAGLAPRFCAYPTRDREEASFWSTYVEAEPMSKASEANPPAPRSIEETLGSTFTEASEIIRDVISSPPEQVQLDLREYVGQIALRFFREAGRLTTAGVRHSKDELFVELGLLPKYRKFYDVLLRMLERAGYAEANATAVWLARDVEAHDIDELCGRFASRYPNIADCFEFPRYTSPYFRRVMTGQYSALRVMYPKGDLNFFQNTFTRLGDELGTYFAKVGVQGLCEFLRQKHGRTLRIVEAGAGMGVLTRQILPRLRADDDVEYWYTDIGNAFVQNARSEFRQHPFMRFATYDISKSPSEQGIEECDVLLAYNVVHTTPSVRDTLRLMKQALAPGGFIFLIESAKNEDWATLSWGLLDGWWSFEDRDLRPSELMLNLEQWEQVGKDCSFDLVYTFPKAPEQRRLIEKSVIVLGTTSPVMAEAVAPRAPASESRPAEPAPPRPEPPLAVVAAPSEIAGSDGPELMMQLTAIWQQILGLQTIAARDSFYDLGGDSLLAIKLVEEVDRRLGLHIDVSDVYAFPSLEELAGFIETKRSRPSQIVEKGALDGPGLESILDAVLDDRLSLDGAIDAIGGGR